MHVKFEDTGAGLMPYYISETIEGFCKRHGKSCVIATVSGEKQCCGVLLLGITTSRNDQLVIKTYFMYLQYEDSLPKEVQASPEAKVQSLFHDVHSIAVHNSEVINSHNELIKVKTSERAPLIIKSMMIDLIVDGKKVSKNFTISSDDTMNILMLKIHQQRGKMLEPYVHDHEHVQREMHETMSDFVAKTSVGRALHFYTILKDYKFSLNESVSLAAKQNNGVAITKNIVYFDLNNHWFAMRVYDKFAGADADDAKTFSKKYEKITGFDYCEHVALKSEEPTYTAILSSALDIFLFPMGNGCCIHQPTLKGKSRPDCYISKLDPEEDGTPQGPVLMFDFKLKDDDYSTAIKESFGHLQSAYNHHQNAFPIIAMPCTPSHISLHLCWLHLNMLACIQICEAKSPKFANLFTALKWAVHEFPTEPFSNKAIEPIKDTKLEIKLSSHVFRDDRTVYKLYDNNNEASWCKPNLGIIEIPYVGKFWSGKKLANRGLFANILLAN